MTITDSKGRAHHAAGAPASTGGQYAQQPAPAAAAELPSPRTGDDYLALVQDPGSPTSRCDTDTQNFLLARLAAERIHEVHPGIAKLEWSDMGDWMEARYFDADGKRMNLEPDVQDDVEDAYFFATGTGPGPLAGEGAYGRTLDLTRDWEAEAIQHRDAAMQGLVETNDIWLSDGASDPGSWPMLDAWKAGDRRPELAVQAASWMLRAHQDTGLDLDRGIPGGWEIVALTLGSARTSRVTDEELAVYDGLELASRPRKA